MHSNSTVQNHCLILFDLKKKSYCVNADLTESTISILQTIISQLKSTFLALRRMHGFEGFKVVFPPHHINELGNGQPKVHMHHIRDIGHRACQFVVMAEQSPQ